MEIASNTCTKLPVIVQSPVILSPQSLVSQFWKIFIYQSGLVPVVAVTKWLGLIVNVLSFTDIVAHSSTSCKTVGLTVQ